MNSAERPPRISQRIDRLAGFLGGHRLFAGLLFGVCLASYGLLIPRLGFYWDDWPFIWIAQIVPSIELGFLEPHRPLTGWMFAALKPLLGAVPLRWQIFTFTSRWLSSLALWWALRQVWPARRREAAWTALLFLVYPSFGGQHVAVNSSRHILPLALLIFSFGLTAAGIRRGPSRSRTALALGFTAASMLTTDYFYGLEALRPAFMLSIAAESGRGWRSPLRETLRLWAPYALVWASILGWRATLGEAGFYTVEFLGSSLGERLARSGSAVAAVAFGTWAEAFQLPSAADIGSRSILVYWAVLIAVGSGSGLYLMLAQRAGCGSGRAPGRTADRRWGLTAAAVGFAGILAGGAPAWAANLPIDLTFPENRLTLPMILGASLLWAGALSFIRIGVLRTTILGLALAFAAGHHFRTAIDFRWDWERQQAFFQQLVTRIPGLEPGTVILTEQLPFRFETDNSMTAPLNWIYAPENEGSAMDYMLYDVKTRLGREFAALKTGQPIDDEYRRFARSRSFTFTGSTAEALLLYHPHPGCLRVIRPAYDSFATGLPPLVARSLPLSDIGRIQLDPPQPAGLPAGLFDPPSGENWCTFFQRAEIARQVGDWETVALLADRALELPGSPSQPEEYAPYVEAYGRSGRWERAEELTGLALARDPFLDGMFCFIWDRIEASAPATSDQAMVLARVRASLACPPR